MSIRVVCSSCLRDLKFNPSEAGLSRKCPGCGTAITVPGDAAGAHSGHSSRSTLMLEFIIAGVILVAAVIGALLWFKAVQREQAMRPTAANGSSKPVSTSPNTKPVAKPVVKAAPVVNPISALLAGHEDLRLGPATVQIARISTAAATPVLKHTPRAGNVYAAISLNVSFVEQGPAFDSYSLTLVPPGGAPSKVDVVTGLDAKGAPYEDPRKRMDSSDIPSSGVKLDVYFQIPSSTDPGTCQLLYK